MPQLSGMVSMLGAEWLAGRRARWTAPFSLFLVVNLLYFLSPSVTDFKLPLKDQLTSQSYSGWAVERVDARFPGTKELLTTDITGMSEEEVAELRPKGLEDFADRYDSRSRDLSKSLLILHVPILAAALCILQRKKQVFFVISGLILSSCAEA